MNIFSNISELIGSVRTALSLKTLQGQWKEMISMLAPQRSHIQTEDLPADETVFCMRVRLREWPRGEGTLVTTRKQNFTFGNSDTFDICLHAGDMQVGDVWCSVFYDKTLNGYVCMQAMGSFNVCVTGDNEPYRHGDWSLYPEGFDYRTIAQNDLIIPVGTKENHEKVVFHIDNFYYFEMWAYKAEAEILSASADSVQNSDEPLVIAQEPAEEESEETPQKGDEDICLQ